MIAVVSILISSLVPIGIHDHVSVIVTRNSNGNPCRSFAVYARIRRARVVDSFFYFVPQYHRVVSNKSRTRAHARVGFALIDSSPLFFGLE